MVAGSYSGRVKAMHNERGLEIEEAGPATPVRVIRLETEHQVLVTLSM